MKWKLGLLTIFNDVMVENSADDGGFPDNLHTGQEAEAVAHITLSCWTMA